MAVSTGVLIRPVSPCMAAPRLWTEALSSVPGKRPAQLTTTMEAISPMTIRTPRSSTTVKPAREERAVVLALPRLKLYLAVF